MAEDIKKEEQEVEETEVDEEQEETVEDNTEEVEEVKDDKEDQIKVLQAEVDKWKNEYYKVFADMENVKRRLQNEHANSLKFMAQGIVEQMLPIVDNFERSLAVENPSDEVAGFLKGYEMIYKQIVTLLENQGVKVIETKGKEFDPNFHQAVMTVNDENYKPGMIVEELQKGYMLKDRVIRASLVKVSE
ncbi:MAG: nucleotide exchange factor GrpE [Faecalibacillus sp.]